MLILLRLEPLAVDQACGTFRRVPVGFLLSERAAEAAAVRIRYRNAEAECELILGEAARVRLDDALLEALNGWLKPENVEVVYQ